jgi:hypothetical protein
LTSRASGDELGRDGSTAPRDARGRDPREQTHPGNWKSKGLARLAPRAPLATGGWVRHVILVGLSGRHKGKGLHPTAARAEEVLAVTSKQCSCKLPGRGKESDAVSLQINLWRRASFQEVIATREIRGPQLIIVPGRTIIANGLSAPHTCFRGPPQSCARLCRERQYVLK